MADIARPIGRLILPQRQSASLWPACPTLGCIAAAQQRACPGRSGCASPHPQQSSGAIAVFSHDPGRGQKQVIADTPDLCTVGNPPEAKTRWPKEIEILRGGCSIGERGELFEWLTMNLRCYEEQKFART